MCLEVTNGLPVACISFSGPLRCATQQLDACFKVLRAGYLNSVPRWRSVPESSMSEGAILVVSEVITGPTVLIIDTAPSSRCVLQGLRPW